MIKKIVAGTFLLFCILLIGASLYTWHIEKIDNIVRFEIQNYSREHLPVDIIPERVTFTLLPMTIVVSNIKVIPKKELAKQVSGELKPLDIREVRVRPSFLHLLIGKLHLAKIEVTGTHVQGAFAIKGSAGDTPIHLRQWLEQIPVTQFKLSQVDVDVTVKDRTGTYAASAQGFDAVITNDVNSLLANLKLTTLNGSFNGKQVIKEAFFETHFFLTERNLVLSDFKFREEADFIVASGSTQHTLAKKTISSGNLNIRSHVGFKRGHDLYELFKKDGEENPFDSLQGELRTDLRLHFTGVNKYSIKTTTALQGLAVEKFRVGDIEFNGQYDSDSKIITGDQVTVSNAGLQATVKKFAMGLNELTFKGAELHVERFQLYSFLEDALKIKIPADVKAEGTVHCDGQIKNFRVDCTGGLSAADAHVNPGKVPIIESLPRASIEGSVSINDKEVTYKAGIAMGSSKGTSDGTINFKKGFLINYESPNLNLSEIKKVSVLDLEGVAKVSGSTQGTSDWATFEIGLDAKNAVLSKYKLGDLTANIKYKARHLTIDKIQGSLVSSRYLGQLGIDLENDTLNGRLQFPFVDIAIVKDAIKEHLPIPVDLAGSGSAIVNIDGPLDTDRLSFKAKARLYNCKVDQQHVDTAEVDLSSVLGRITFNSAYFEEKSSNLLFKGQILLDKKEYDLAFSSQHVQLDDLAYSKTYSAPTKGLFQLDGKVRGTFQNPALDFHFSSDSFAVAGQKLSPLMGDVKLNQERNSAEILGPNGLKISYRDVKSTPEIHIEGTTQEMNLAPLLTSLLDLERVEDYNILASSSFNLKINRKEPSKVNGYVFLPSLEVSMQKIDMKNEKEISIFFTNGKASFAPINMAGHGGKIQFKATPASSSPFDFQVTGLFNLGFLQIFAPFLETLEGQTSVNFRVQQSPAGKLGFSGMAFIEDGFVKLPEIQHALEELKIDLLFNQDQIVINSIKGRFASGQVIGDGHITLKGKKDLPLQIKLHLDNVDLNIPTDVNTIGNADLQLSGNWLPFLLSGTYDVTDGSINKEFSSSDATTLNPHQIFLPAALRDESVSPIRLDLDINPTVPLKIKNSLVEGKVQGKLKVTGFPQSPALAGNISFTKNTQLNLKDVIFKVRDSSIALTGTNPPNPNLYILADARYLGYDIEMLVQGTAEKPKFKFSSQPSLTEPEIISLLTVGYTSADQTAQANAALGTVNKSSTSTLGNQQQLEVGSGLFSTNPLGKEFKNRFGFDVQVSSRFDAATSVAVPKISATKQFSERVSGVYSVQTGRDSRREGKVRYELNRGFAATLSLQSQTQEETNVQRGDAISDILGLDLEFRKEFK